MCEQLRLVTCFIHLASFYYNFETIIFFVSCFSEVNIEFLCTFSILQPKHTKISYLIHHSLSFLNNLQLLRNIISSPKSERRSISECTCHHIYGHTDDKAISFFIETSLWPCMSDCLSVDWLVCHNFKFHFPCSHSLRTYAAHLQDCSYIWCLHY